MKYFVKPSEPAWLPAREDDSHEVLPRRRNHHNVVRRRRCADAAARAHGARRGGEPAGEPACLLRPRGLRRLRHRRPEPRRVGARRRRGAARRPALGLLLPLRRLRPGPHGRLPRGVAQVPRGVARPGPRPGLGARRAPGEPGPPKRGRAHLPLQGLGPQRHDEPHDELARETRSEPHVRAPAPRAARAAERGTRPPARPRAPLGVRGARGARAGHVAQRRDGARPLAVVRAVPLRPRAAGHGPRGPRARRPPHALLPRRHAPERARRHARHRRARADAKNGLPRRGGREIFDRARRRGAPGPGARDLRGRPRAHLGGPPLARARAPLLHARFRASADVLRALRRVRPGPARLRRLPREALPRRGPARRGLRAGLRGARGRGGAGGAARRAQDGRQLLRAPVHAPARGLARAPPGAGDRRARRRLARAAPLRRVAPRARRARLRRPGAALRHGAAGVRGRGAGPLRGAGPAGGLRAARGRARGGRGQRHGAGHHGRRGLVAMSVPRGSSRAT